MKKLFALMTVLVMLLCSAAIAETAEITGEWYMTEMNMEGMSINPATMGMDIMMVLNEDGTATLTSVTGEDEPQVQEAAWKQEESGIVLTIEEETTTLTLEDGSLKMALDENNYYLFAREKAEAAPLPTPVAAENEEAFFGTWTMSQIEMGGIMLPASMMGMDAAVMTVEAGKVVVTSGEENTEYTSAFADGALTITENIENAEPMSLVLNDDGSLAMPVAFGEEVMMTVYFTKAE